MIELSKHIDVYEVIEKKNPKLAKKLPKFVINYLKKIIHQDEINDIMQRIGNKTGLDFIDSCIRELDLKMELHDTENIPPEGKYIFVANHPLGGLESMVFMKVVSFHFPKIKFVVNDILMALTPLRSIFIPINKHGKQSKDATTELNEAYASDNQMLYFPAGLCSRKIKGQIVDLEWKPNFIKKATEYQRDIIPVFIGGQNSKFFYNLANIRKRLKIKSNIEMLYLVDEMFKQRGQTITLTFGKPIPYSTFDKSKSPKEWAQYIKEIVYKMK